MDEQLIRVECLKVAVAAARHYNYPMLIDFSNKLVDWVKTGEMPDFSASNEQADQD